MKRFFLGHPVYIFFKYVYPHAVKCQFVFKMQILIKTNKQTHQGSSPLYTIYIHITQETIKKHGRRRLIYSVLELLPRKGKCNMYLYFATKFINFVFLEINNIFRLRRAVKRALLLWTSCFLIQTFLFQCPKEPYKLLR